jgi:hypothetical protein
MINNFQSEQFLHDLDETDIDSSGEEESLQVDDDPNSHFFQIAIATEFEGGLHFFTS